MELELKKTSLDTYETTGEVTLSQDATAETIVPDYCPDIARMIETEGTVFLHSREVHGGKAELAGTVRICVLYTPEGEGGIRALDFAIPFTVESDNRSFQHCRYLAAEVEIEQLEENLWRADGTVALDTLADALDMELPLDEEYDTLGGMVFSLFSSIPEDGTKPSVTINGLHIQVENISEHRIETALVSKVQVDPSAENTDDEDSEENE